MAPSALDILNAERARQREDACASFIGAADGAKAIADAICQTNRLVLIGMGGSHFINLVAEPFYRDAGVEATAHTPTELIETPLPDSPRVCLLTSQSGASSEMRDYLRLAPGRERRFGLTLEKESALAQARPCLIGAGGTEKSFAAARSLLITLALHATILHALGQDQSGAMDWIAKSHDIVTKKLVTALSGAASVIFVAPARLRGVAQSAGLTLMELARIPVLALEYSQFRHGPIEALTEKTGIILIEDGDGADAFAEEIAGFARSAGSKIVALNLGPEGPGSVETRMGVPHGPGIARSAAALLACQALAIELAAARVPDVGRPRLARKVM